MFGIFLRLSIEQQYQNHSSFFYLCLLLVQHGLGVLMGAGMGYLGKILNIITQESVRIYLKFMYCGVCAVSFSVFSTVFSQYSETKYLACLVFGFVSKQIWNTDLPTSLLDQHWLLVQTVLFSTTGAALSLECIQFGVIIKSTVLLMICIVVRVFTTFIVTRSTPTLSLKERIFMSMAWLPKATIQGALCSTFLYELSKQPFLSSDSQLQEYGQIILQSSILSIIICSTLGCFLIQRLGKSYLKFEQDFTNENMMLTLNLFYSSKPLSKPSSQ